MRNDPSTTPDAVTGYKDPNQDVSKNKLSQN